MSERTSEAQVTSKAVSNQLHNMAHASLSASEVRELIASRAYELYKHRGTECGDELSDWLKAEAAVVTMLLAEAEAPDETESGNGGPPARTRNARSGRKSAKHPPASRPAKPRKRPNVNPA